MPPRSQMFQPVGRGKVTDQARQLLVLFLLYVAFLIQNGRKGLAYLAANSLERFHKVLIKLQVNLSLYAEPNFSLSPYGSRQLFLQPLL